MTRTHLLLLALLPASVSAQNAPFCVVSSAGERCFYYSADQCRTAAASANGMCVARSSAPQRSQPSLFDMHQQNAEAGERARESGRRDALLKAQLEALKAKPAAALAVTYDCPAGNGSVYRTDAPAIGCVVVGIGANSLPDKR